MFDEIVWNRQTSLMRIYDADFTVAGPELATVYGLPAPDGSGLVDVSSVPAIGAM